MSEHFIDRAALEASQRTLSAQATEFMLTRRGAGGALIYVGTQHPLVEGADGKRNQPGDELRARLEAAADLYRKFTARGQSATIFAWADLHRDKEGVWDDISLAEASTNYLLEIGVPESATVPNRIVRSLLDEVGLDRIGNGQDETRVVSQLFKRDARFEFLYAIGGGNQVARMKQGCLLQGVRATPVAPPVFDRDGNPVPDDKAHHNGAVEVFLTADLAYTAVDLEAARRQAEIDAATRESRSLPGDMPPASPPAFYRQTLSEFTLA